MPRCDWLQHCNFLAGIEILPIALQTACKPFGFAAGRPAIVAGPVLRVAIGESCSVCRALYSVSVCLQTLELLMIKKEKISRGGKGGGGSGGMPTRPPPTP